MCNLLAIIKDMECFDFTIFDDVIVTRVAIQAFSGQVDMDKNVAVFLNHVQRNHTQARVVARQVSEMISHPITNTIIGA